MRFLFFLVHPSKFHVFRNTINTLKKNGHLVDILIISKDVLEDLVKSEGWEYTNIFPSGRRIKGLPKFFGVFINFFRTLKKLNDYIKIKKYNLFITDDLLVLIGKIHCIPSFLFQDDDLDVVPETRILFHFTDYILCPIVTNVGPYRHKKIPFWGYKELGGFHPSVFSPQKSKIKKNIPNDRKFFLLRLVSLTAVHDTGKSGLSNEDVKNLISILKSRGDVFITSQRALPAELEEFRLDISPEDMPHVLHYAEMLISDSQTMSAEAAVLGTPFIRFNDFVGKISYLSELEEVYHLGIGIKTKDKSLLFSTVKELTCRSNLKEEWGKKRNLMLSQKVNLSEYLVWLFENYPTSCSILKKNPKFQRKFIQKNQTIPPLLLD